MAKHWFAAIAISPTAMLITVGMPAPPNSAGADKPPQPAFAVRLVGFLEALGRAHHAILEMAAFLVAGLVDGLKHVLADLARVGQDVVDQVGREVFEARQVALLFRFQEFVDQEAVILHWGAIDRHVSPSRKIRFYAGGG